MKLAEQFKRRLEEATREAAEAWQEFDAARKAAVESGADLTQGGEAFEDLHALNVTYSEAAQAVTDLQARFTQALEIEGAGAPAADEPTRRETEARAERAGIWTPGLKYVESETYQKMASAGALTKQRVEVPTVELADRDGLKAMLEGKALITGASDTSGGIFVQPERLAGYYPLLFSPLFVTQLITVGETDSDMVEFVQESTFTNSAAEVAEATATSGGGYDAGVKPESALAFALVQATVQTIAHWVPVTKRALADAGQLRTIIDQRLEDGVAMRLQTQIINGNGTAPNLRGILNTVGIGSITRNVGGPTNETGMEAILRAITTVRLAFLEPNAIGLHPNDYVTMRLSKDSTGNYLMGAPNLPGADSLWGLPIHQSTAYPADTALVGKYDEAILWVREGVTVTATDSHADFFTHNLVAILAEGRYAFGVPRPAAFCKVLDVTA